MGKSPVPFSFRGFTMTWIQWFETLTPLAQLLLRCSIENHIRLTEKLSGIADLNPELVASATAKSANAAPKLETAPKPSTVHTV